MYGAPAAATERWAAFLGSVGCITVHHPSACSRQPSNPSGLPQASGFRSSHGSKRCRAQRSRNHPRPSGSDCGRGDVSRAFRSQAVLPRTRLVRPPALPSAALLELAEALQRDPYCVAFDAGDIRVEQKWNHGVKSSYTLRQAMENIERTGAWIILKHSETVPEYREVMEEILCDVEDLSGADLRQSIKNAEAQIIITSPGRITPYHFDNECNVLLQIAGEKDFYVFDQTDREVLTEVELEKFWAGDWNAGEYKARCQERAQAFRLAPGKGAHIPVNAPHWVK